LNGLEYDHASDASDSYCSVSAAVTAPQNPYYKGGATQVHLRSMVRSPKPIWITTAKISWV
jgi:hypothetical protein